MTSTIPGRIKDVLSIPLASARALTLTPNSSAISKSVSPAWTVYVCPEGGAGVAVELGVAETAATLVTLVLTCVATTVGEPVAVGGARVRLGVGGGVSVGVGVSVARGVLVGVGVRLGVGVNVGV
jgi:hypothetical protein